MHWLRIVMAIGLCFAYCDASFAQDYIPITHPDNNWIIDQYDGSDIPSVYNAYLLRFEGDTTIDLRQFRKLYRWNLSGTQPCPPEDRPCFVYDIPIQTIGQRALVALIHENIELQIVSAIPVSAAINCTDELNTIFDFSLEIGERIDSCARQVIGASDNPSWGNVDSIRSLETFGRPRVIHFSTGIQTYIGLPTEGAVMIVQGVGWSQYGILFSNEGRDILSDFCSGSLEECNITSSTTKPVQPQLSVFPNPATDYLTVASQSPIVSIELWSLNGTLAIESRKRVQQIDVSGLRPGSYVVKVNFSDSVSRTIAVVITH